MRRVVLAASLLLVSLHCEAEAGVTWEKTNRLSHSGATVTATASPTVTACGLRLYDVVAGETMVAYGDITVTNDTDGVVGFTTEIYACSPTCRNLRSGASYSGIEGGNVTPQMHHATFQPQAMTSWDVPQGSVSLILTLRSYSSTEAGGHVTIDRCGLLVTRYRP